MIGDVVHYYDTNLRHMMPNGVGPWPAIVVADHGDDLLTVHVFGCGDYRAVAPVSDEPSEQVTGWWQPRGS